MPNSELEALENIISQFKYSSLYETFLEVSPLLYQYFQKKYETAIENYDLQDIFPYPQTLYGIPVSINIYLNNFDYQIIRKEKVKGYEQ